MTGNVVEKEDQGVDCQPNGLITLNILKPLIIINLSRCSGQNDKIGQLVGLRTH